jgi:hypothetical protein
MQVVSVTNWAKTTLHWSPIFSFVSTELVRAVKNVSESILHRRGHRLPSQRVDVQLFGFGGPLTLVSFQVIELLLMIPGWAGPLAGYAA